MVQYVGENLNKVEITELIYVTISDIIVPPQFVESFGENGNNKGEFNFAHGIVVTDDRMYVADRLNNRI